MDDRRIVKTNEQTRERDREKEETLVTITPLHLVLEEVALRPQLMTNDLNPVKELPPPAAYSMTMTKMLVVQGGTCTLPAVNACVPTETLDVSTERGAPTRKTDDVGVMRCGGGLSPSLHILDLQTTVCMLFRRWRSLVLIRHQ
jgi:hypothetical protein